MFLHLHENLPYFLTLNITTLLTPFKILWKFAKKYFCNVDNFCNKVIIKYLIFTLSN